MKFGVWLVGVLVGSLGLARPAAACGGGGVTTTTNGGVVVNTQRVVFSVHDDGTTDIVVQITVPATNADYGVLIPVPSEPTLDDEPVSADDLETLDELTQPLIKSDVPEPDSGGSGCSCGTGGDDDAGSGAGATTGVSVGNPVDIGPVTAVSLTGTDADAVNGWLADNGFVIPDDRLDLLDSYVGDGRYFIAVKRNDSTADSAPSSIGIHYSLAGDYRQLSLAFARLGAASTVSFTVFVAKKPYLVRPSAPWTAISLGDLDAKLLRNGDYTDAVRLAVLANGSRAFVYESATPKSGLIGANALGGPPLSTGSPLLALFDDDQWINRLSTVLDADALTEDASFDAPGPTTAPVRERYVLRATPAVKYASIGWFLALGAGRMLRRRGRLNRRRSRRS